MGLIFVRDEQYRILIIPVLFDALCTDSGVIFDRRIKATDGIASSPEVPRRQWTPCACTVHNM